MKIFAISDTHFGHNKLIEYGRPKEFSADIMSNIKRAEGDILIHCGDFCIGRDKDWHISFMMNTVGFKKKILVRGNHDNKSDSWYYNNGWDFICRETVLKIFGKLVLFTHKPLPVENKGELFMNIHGHLHGGGKNSHRMVEGGTYDNNFHFDLAPDTNNYKLVDLSKVIV